MSIVDALSGVLHDANINKCFFHFFPKRIQVSALQDTYNNNAQFSQYFRLIAAVAVDWLPPKLEIGEVVTKLEMHIIQMLLKLLIISKIHTSVDIEEFPHVDLLYLQQRCGIWSTGHIRKQRKPITTLKAVFFWFQSLCVAWHPTFYKSISTSKKEQSIVYRH